MAKYDYHLSIEHERATDERKAMVARVMRKRAARGVSARDRIRTVTLERNMPPEVGIPPESRPG